MVAVSKLSALNTLTLSLMSNTLQPDLTWLSKLPNLTHVRMYTAELKDAQMVQIRALPALLRIGVFRNDQLSRLLQPPPDPRERNHDVSPALAGIVHRLLARSPDDRFATAAEVVQALRSAKSSVRPVEKALVLRDEPRGEKAVAVLPLKSQGAPDWAAQGLLEDLIDTLPMTRGLRVRPVGVVEPFAGTQKAARDVGRERGVSVVVEGSIRAAGAELRLSVRAMRRRRIPDLGAAMAAGRRRRSSRSPTRPHERSQTR